MYFIGFVVRFLAGGIILLMAGAGIEQGLREKDEERIEKEVERRVNYILSHAEIRVKQKLYIVDDTKKGGEHDDL